MQSRHAACERARMWAILLPDGELSLFEQRLLEAHCTHCAECRHVLESVRGLTEVIRATSLEEMDRRVRVLRGRPWYWRPVSGVLASGGAAALALMLAFWVGPQHGAHVRTLVVTAPVVVFTPEASTADSAAIWRLKRTRSATPIAGNDRRRTGAVLS